MNTESPDMNQEAGVSRWKVLVLLAVVIVTPPIIARLALHFAGGNAYLMIARYVVYAACLIGLPLFARRSWPRLAGFDITWLPRRRWWLHLSAGVGLAVLMILWSAGVRLVLQRYGMWQDPVRVSGGNLPLLSPDVVLAYATTIVLLAPIAEEFFCRGFVFAQLKKVTLWPVALAGQALIFSLVHAYPWGASLEVFGAGLLLGLWRQRKRSLVPVIMAHMALLAIWAAPWATESYRQAKLMQLTEGTDLDVVEILGDYQERIRNHPLTPKIDRAARKPPRKAIPALIEFLKEEDEAPRLYAGGMLMEHFGNDACPYLRNLLHSDNPHAVQSAVDLVAFCKCDELADEVVDLCLETEDTRLAISAIGTLEMLKNWQGLRNVASKHRNKKLRQLARQMLEGWGQATSAEQEEP